MSPMMLPRLNSSSLRLPALLVSTSLVAFSTPAWAMDATALMERYQKLAEKQGAKIEYDDLLDTDDGRAVRVRGLSVTRPHMKNPVRFHEITIAGAKDIGEDGFAAERVAFSGMSYATVDPEGRDVTVTIDSGEASGVYIPDPEDIDAPLFEYDRTSVNLGYVEVTINGNPALSLVSVFGEAALDNDSKTHRTTAEIGSIVFHTDNITDAEAKARLEKLGIDTIEMSVQFGATWNLGTGRVELHEYTVDAADYGRLSVDLTLDGYTEELATDVRLMSAERNAIEAGDREAAKASTRKLMDKLSQLEVVDGRIAYVDRSLAGKILEHQATEMGGSREDIIDLASTMAGGMTQALENPGFSTMLSGAIRTFLSDPKNFAVSIKPADPMAITEIFGAALMSPSSLIDKLGVKTIANE